jgi:hypothetical protein
MRPSLRSLALSWLLAGLFLTQAAESPEGYYRQPTLRGDTVVLVGEGALW